MKSSKCKYPLSTAGTMPIIVSNRWCFYNIQAFEMEPLFTFIIADHMFTIVRQSADAKDKTFFCFVNWLHV